MVKFVAPATGPVKSSDGNSVTAEFTFENSRSTYFDTVVFVGGPEGYEKNFKNGRLVHVIREAYFHKKAIGATGSAVRWVTDMCLPGEFSEGAKNDKEGVVLENGVVLAQSLGTGAEFAAKFLDGVSKHRVWDREVSHIAA